jgi:hypothetical protein
MLVFGGVDHTSQLADLWSLTWGQPVAPGILCPGVIERSGDRVQATYVLSNPLSGSRAVEWALSHDVGPSGVESGTAMLAGGATETLRVSIPITDSTGRAKAWSLTDWFSGARGNETRCTQNVDWATEALVSLAFVHAEPGRVRVAWWLSDRIQARAVERRARDSTWEGHGVPVDRGRGRWEFEDREVVDGGAYEYRLRYEGPDGVGRGGEVRVRIPERFELTLEPSRSNPSPGALRVTLVLPESGPAELGIFYLMGRRVGSHRLELNRGRHDLDLPETLRLRAGAYHLTLGQTGRSVAAQIVILR